MTAVVPERAEEEEPNQRKVGWQQSAARSLETKFLNERVWPGMSDAERALLRSQRGPLASAAVTAQRSPITQGHQDGWSTFRIRLRLPLPLSSRTCRCGRQLDSFGHHRPTCSEAGVLGRRGFHLEVAAAQVCREAVAPRHHERLRDLAAFDVMDSRRLEVVADGLTAFRGAQLAIDTTLVSALRRDGTARPGAATRAGAALTARRMKGRTLSSPIKGAEPGWLFWLRRSEGDGLPRLLNSWSPSRTAKQSQRPSSSEVAWRQLGCNGGAPCWLAVQSRPSPTPCSIVRLRGAATTSPPRLRVCWRLPLGLAPDVLGTTMCPKQACRISINTSILV